MKSNLILSLFALCFIFISCNNDDPQPVEPAPAANEVTVTAATPPQPDPITQQKQTQFPDSAFFQPENFNGMPYQIMFPRKYDSTKVYPVVIFLHGIDERGTDNEKQLKWGASMFKTDSVSENYPAFVVFPQCPSSTYWHDASTSEKLKSVIDNLINTRSIDRNRVYIEGLSMGAYGTYAMVAKYPALFAAAIAISGDGDVNKADELAQANWKIFGGDKDTIVPGEKSLKMADAIRSSGAEVAVKIYPNATHVDTWVNAFKEPDYFSWIFSQRKN